MIVAGGMESMSSTPYLMTGARHGFRMGNQRVLDSMIHDGLWDSYNDYHMGNTGEVVLPSAGRSVASSKTSGRSSRTRRPSRRSTPGQFVKEIVPVEVPQRKKDPILFDTDEGPRRDTSIEALAEAAPGVQERRHGHGRERPGRQRRRVGRCRDLGREGEERSA